MRNRFDLSLFRNAALYLLRMHSNAISIFQYSSFIPHTENSRTVCLPQGADDMNRAIKILFALSAMSLCACGTQKSDLRNNDSALSVSVFSETDESNPRKSGSAADFPASKENQMTSHDISFDFKTRSVTLNSGYEMPIYGIGTYSLQGETCVDALKTALQEGVRLIDTAYMYHNEESVGKAVRECGIPREEIFVATKLYPNQFSDPEAAIEQALEKLDIGYIDLMLLHHPGENDLKAYRAIEKAVEDGKIRSIGLSNWYIEELTEFLPDVRIMPALVQNEIHPYYQENEVIPFILSKGIVVQGWYPLGGRGHQKELLSDPVLKEIAAAHNKSVAQVILRWNLQKGVVVIPGSSNPDHIRENTELFDFELTEEEMNRIKTLERFEKHDWY